VRCVVVLAPFQEQSVDIAAIFRSFGYILMSDVVQDVVVIGHYVNRVLVLSSIILESTSQERLREEEPREPELDGSAVLNPVVKEINSIVAILNPGS